MKKRNNFWIQATVALILATAITAATVAVAPSGLLDQASARAGFAEEMFAADDSAPEQAGRSCWLVCWR